MVHIPVGLVNVTVSGCTRMATHMGLFLPVRLYPPSQLTSCGALQCVICAPLHRPLPLLTDHRRPYQGPHHRRPCQGPHHRRPCRDHTIEDRPNDLTSGHYQGLHRSGLVGVPLVRGPTDHTTLQFLGLASNTT